MVEATVLIAAWKAEDFLHRSVSSALAQDSVELEVVIVDDASPDRTAAVAAELARDDPRVRVLSLPRNSGPAAARNAGIEVARGSWIAVLDADDAMTPGRLAAMIRHARSEEAEVVCDNIQVVDEAGVPTGRPYLDGAHYTQSLSWDLESYLAGNQAEPGNPSLGFLKPMISRDLLKRTGIRYDPRLRNGEDFHLILALLAAGARLHYLPKPGYLYTSRKGSVSNRLDPAHAATLAQADRSFLASRSDTLSPRAKQLLERRIRRIADLATSETAMQALKALRPDLATFALIRRPRAVGRLALQLREAIRHRMP